MVTLEQVNRLLRYEPETGKFYWIAKCHWASRVTIGGEAGNTCVKGYVHIKIFDKSYLAHRLAWLMTFGSWPNGHLDHADQNPSNNRISNLREATRSQNKYNHGARSDSRTGCRGVTKTPDGHYRVRITVDKERLYLGQFEDLEFAALVYDSAADRFHGRFSYCRAGVAA